MDYGYDLKNNILHLCCNQAPANEYETNEIGVCSACGANLSSISYHSFDDSLIIVAKCPGCNSIYANVYSTDWIWLDEIGISHFSTEGLGNNSSSGPSHQVEKSSANYTFKS